jgi:predicted RNase H-like HicB family nuclease
LIDFPDCPGCQTFGDTREEALAMAAEALEGWLQTHLEHGEFPPRPRAQRGVAINVPGSARSEAATSGKREIRPRR